MKLNTTRGEILLPKDFAFQIQQNHPFFSDEGSASVPATLPSCTDNNKTLGHPADINRNKRFGKHFEALLQSGSIVKRCRLVVSSGHKLDGFDASIALDESEAYAELQKKPLRELVDTMEYTPLRYSPWDIYTSSARRAVVIFPVACDVTGNGTQAVVQQLNKVNSSENDFIYAARTIPHGEGQVSVPEGYGLTCFLRLPELINSLFTQCGYTVAYNVFSQNAQLNNLVLLNQCADAMLSGTFATRDWSVPYRDIVPDITMGEFITWLHDKFGVFITVENRSVKILSYEFTCSTAADIDLTPYLDGSEKPTVSYPDPKALVLEVDTSLEGAAPAADSLEALHASHPLCATVMDTSAATGSGMWLVAPMGKYYFRNKDWGTLSMLGSNAFPYKRTTEVTEEEAYKSADIFAPMVKTDAKFMPYIGDTIRRNQEIDDNDKDATQSLMVCYALYHNGHWCGSQTGYYDDGTASASIIGLDPEALRERYWKAYEEQLINGAPEISCKFIMPVSLLMDMSKWTPKIFHGMKVFIKSLDYTLSDYPTTEVEAVLQTVPDYEDKVEIPEIVFGSRLKWVRAVDDDQSDLPSGWATDYDYISGDGLTDYRPADAPTQKPTTVGQVAKRRERYFTYEETNYGYPTGHYGTHYYYEYFVAVYDND